ncbi:hypothetical protein EYF80_024822 [Liparis tanakae]|uniref:Uncharacterized protein n=1 Tax=Liparis tanakae TaxID=230148 RepID=A0A4Z2HGD6_9TELE|nr:hypothetical protein EYF80_024822 [Liparis tanakae]
MEATQTEVTAPLSPGSLQRTPLHACCHPEDQSVAASSFVSELLSGDDTLLHPGPHRQVQACSRTSRLKRRDDR